MTREMRGVAIQRDGRHRHGYAATVVHHDVRRHGIAEGQQLAFGGRFHRNAGGLEQRGGAAVAHLRHGGIRVELRRRAIHEIRSAPVADGQLAGGHPRVHRVHGRCYHRQVRDDPLRVPQIERRPRRIGVDDRYPKELPPVDGQPRVEPRDRGVDTVED